MFIKVILSFCGALNLLYVCCSLLEGKANSLDDQASKKTCMESNVVRE